ncbi:diguanylate cyclase domain-containing protein [Singulisphaera sp. PoT]|uniref:GGDEF domain-containing protein n=1 Tax=Singulisphaera sp. PoT TaxID=3411797 RepID=UPI003BF5FFB2
MLSNIHMQEIFVVFSCYLAMVGLVTLAISFANRNIPGIGQCGAGILLLAMAFLSIVIREYFPEDWVIFLTHAAFLFGVLAICQGLRVFRGRPPMSGPFLTIGTLASLSGCAYSLFVLEDTACRIASVSWWLAVIMFRGAVAMAGDVPPGDRPAYWGTALAVGVDALLLSFRTGFALMTDMGAEANPTNPVEIFVALGISLSTALAVLGIFVSINLRLRREIESLVMVDHLTNLSNRRHFEQCYSRAMLRASLRRQRLALVYMDLNGFKGINDRFGHEAGDEALRVVADRISGVVRRTDCLARLAGDEFALLLENVNSRDEVARLVRRIREVVNAEANLDGNRVMLSVSCGVAMFPEDVDDATHLLRKADASMYAEKRIRFPSRVG